MEENTANKGRSPTVVCCQNLSTWKFQGNIQKLAEKINELVTGQIERFKSIIGRQLGAGGIRIIKW
jgi:hypothetical protein